MSKRRKYDIKNKRSFIIIVILSIVIVGIFSLFIYKYSKTSRVEYTLEAGTVLQDVLKNYITIDEDAVLKIRWNGNYYLEYDDEKITLGRKVITYNTVTGGMKLYGSFYEIASDGKIVEHKNETVLDNTTDAKFYKIDDRQYLLVDTKIYSDDYSIDANSYLLVELDKMGNAKLSNNKLNLKTISPTTLVTTKYTFDIANEILNFGEYDIDLKKIIGSTNQYVPEVPDAPVDSDDEGNDTDSNNEADNTGSDTGNESVGGTTGGVGTGNGTGGDGVINKDDDGEDSELDEILDKVKMTSIVRVFEGLDQIDVDYVIYDPYNEYGSVYVEISSLGKLDVIHLSKTDTHLTIHNLKADTDYKLKFIYTTFITDEETGESDYLPYTFEELDLRTKMPEYSISLHRISTIYDTLEYKVNLQKDFKISKVNVEVSFSDNHVVIEDSVSVVNNEISFVSGDVDVSSVDLRENTIIKLKITSIETSEGQKIDINSASTFRFGGTYENEKYS